MRAPTLFGHAALVAKGSTPGRFSVPKGVAVRVRQPAVRKVLAWIMRVMLSDPGPRTYEGNPAAGAEESPAERRYNEAQKGVKGRKDVVSHTWRW